MINKIKNSTEVVGKLFGFGRFGLEKVERDGVTKIQGSILILINEETQACVEMHFMPQPQVWGTGNVNKNYELLEQIINNKDEVTYEKVKEEAINLKVTGSLNVNDFYIEPKGKTEFIYVEEPQIKTGFVSIDNKQNAKAVFQLEGLFMGIEDEIKDDEVTGNKIVKMGLIDTYRNTISAFKLKITPTQENGPEGIATIETYVPNETIVCLSGIICCDVVTVDKPVEMVFGPSQMSSYQKDEKYFLITGAEVAKSRDGLISDEELEELIKNKNIVKEEALQRKLRNKKAGGPTPQASKPAGQIVKTANAAAKFNF